jgi:hypothetical protein
MAENVVPVTHKRIKKIIKHFNFITTSICMNGLVFRVNNKIKVF